jgi:hypothetical protein
MVIVPSVLFLSMTNVSPASRYSPPLQPAVHAPRLLDQSATYASSLDSSARS